MHTAVEDNSESCSATTEVVVLASPRVVSLILQLEDFYVLKLLSQCNILSNKKFIQWRILINPVMG